MYNELAGFAREDLELVVKAAGVVGMPTISCRGGHLGHENVDKTWTAWNPLISNADCIAMLLRIPTVLKDLPDVYIHILNNMWRSTDEEKERVRRECIQRVVALDWKITHGI